MYINISWKYAILVRNSLKKKFIENIILGGGGWLIHVIPCYATGKDGLRPAWSKMLARI
jgi:hypothetical protein